jgi:ABC-type transport system involved in multi-copper enzyme maturation permease subunit
MNSPTAVLIVRWLVYDTFRQALASRLFWVVSGLTALCVVFCLGIRVRGGGELPLERGEVRMRLPAVLPESRDAAKEGFDNPRGELSLLFGAIRLPYNHYRDNAVGWVQLYLAWFIADTAGVLLALLWTAGFLPSFLEPAAVTVFLARPAPRWSLLVGKYLGVIGFVALQAGVFVVGTWLALGLATGVWSAFYLLCLPVLLLHFSVFFSFSTLLAVWTRNAVVCMVGTLAFWLLCWAVNYACLTALQSGQGGWWLQTGYCVLPKPFDFNSILADGLGAPKLEGPLSVYKTLEQRGVVTLEFSLGTSLAFAACVVGAAVYRFVKADY